MNDGIWYDGNPEYEKHKETCYICKYNGGKVTMVAYRPHTFKPDCWCTETLAVKLCTMSYYREPELAPEGYWYSALYGRSGVAPVTAQRRSEGRTELTVAR
jgi:hypothetical protein